MREGLEYWAKILALLLSSARPSVDGYVVYKYWQCELYERLFFIKEFFSRFL